MNADQGTSRWTTRWTPGLPIALMVVLLVLPTAGSAQLGQTATVKIGFGQTLPDRQIVDLLDGYPGVEVTAARLQVADIKSSHRNADGMPVDRFLPEVRTKMAKHFRGSVERSLFRLRRVVEKHDAATVEADPDLAEEVRSELDFLRRFEHAASTYANGEPVIFALEISGERAALQQVIDDERVRVHRFVGQGLFGADDLDFQIPKTEPPTSDWDVDSLSGAQAYERAREAVRQGRIETDATVKIGFGQALPDRLIVDLLDGYPGVEVTAARLLVGEFKTTHRSGDGMPVDRFLPEARAEVADHFRKGAEADLYRFRRFVEKYDAAQVDADPDLADEARGDLKRARRWAVGASLPSNGEPVIFALEISGERAALEQVVEDQRVRAHWFVGQGLFGAGGEPFRAPTTEPRRSDPEIDSLSGAEAYERMQEALRRGRIETDGGG